MIWAIGDLHLDHTGKKPMDIFGPQWIQHEEKIFNAWEEKIGPQDLVFLVGDHSWAMQLEEARGDLDRLEKLAGKKILIKGNHDYWWSSMNKLEGLGYKSLHFLHNNAYVIDGIGVVGTRGWSDIDSKGFDDHDEKIYKRECNRLELSIGALKELGKTQEIKEVYALIHYPPFSYRGQPNDFAHILSREGIKTCLYGHLHSEGHAFVREGDYEGVNYICVASDYVNFKPVRLK
ncbi:MAG: metallophosphoesterase [Tissierellia bacterium]|nr:metallophosphoesterase [Tissierellia bacterium]